MMKCSHIFNHFAGLILSRTDRCTSCSFNMGGISKILQARLAEPEGAAKSSCAIYMVNMPLKAAQGLCDHVCMCVCARVCTYESGVAVER